MELEGSLLERDPLEFLVEIGRDGFTGAVRYELGDVIRILYFKDGFILSASTNDREDSLDEILLAAGKVNRDHVRQALSRRKDNETLGEALLTLGFISRRELVWARRAQVVGMVRSLTSRREGTYTMVRDYVPRRSEGTLFSLDQILFEVMVTSEDRDAVEASLNGGLRVLRRAFDFDERYSRLDLNDEADQIVRAIDGVRSASELAAESTTDGFTVYKLIRALEVLGLLESDEGTSAPDESVAVMSFGEQTALSFGSDEEEKETVEDLRNDLDEIFDEGLQGEESGDAMDTSESPEEGAAAPEIVAAVPPSETGSLPEIDLASPPVGHDFQEKDRGEPDGEEKLWDISFEEYPEEMGFVGDELETDEEHSVPVEAVETRSFEPGPELVEFENEPEDILGGGAVEVEHDRSTLWEDTGRNRKWFPFVVGCAVVAIVAWVAVSVLGGKAEKEVVSGRGARLQLPEMGVEPPDAEVPEAVDADQNGNQKRPDSVESNAPVRTTQEDDPVRKRYDEMAVRWSRREDRARFTIQFELVCETSSVTLAREAGRDRVWFLPVKYGGRECFRVFWGDYDTSEAAEEAVKEIPPKLRGGKPLIVQISEVLEP